jgi:hypothetical protein
MLVKVTKAAFQILVLIALLVSSTVVVLLSLNESLRDALFALIVIGLLLHIYNRVDQIAKAQEKGDPYAD